MLFCKILQTWPCEEIIYKFGFVEQKFAKVRKFGIRFELGYIVPSCTPTSGFGTIIKTRVEVSLKNIIFVVKFIKSVWFAFNAMNAVRKNLKRYNQNVVKYFFTYIHRLFQRLS